MNIIWVTTQFPSRRSGSQTRQVNLIRHLCGRHSLTILSLFRNEEQNEVQSLKDLGIEVIAEEFCPPKPLGIGANRIKSWAQLLLDPLPNYARTYPLDGLQKCLQSICLSHKPDLIHLEELFTAPLKEPVKGIPFVLTEENVESRNIERQGRLAHSFSCRLAGRIEAYKLRIWERKMLQQFQSCVAVSPEDARDLELLAPNV
jgi:polysaccharide biosynthesis protein PslH